MNKPITYMSTILTENEKLEKKEKVLIETIQILENEIIALRAENKTNEEKIEQLEDVYKNFCMNFDTLINGGKNEH